VNQVHGLDSLARCGDLGHDAQGARVGGASDATHQGAEPIAPQDVSRHQIRNCVIFGPAVRAPFRVQGAPIHSPVRIFEESVSSLGVHRLFTFADVWLLDRISVGSLRSHGGVPTHSVRWRHYTHGRYLPVRTYNNTPDTGGIGSTTASALVVDENFNTTDAARAESGPGEAGPWGGIPGIFAELAAEAGIPYDVHIEAISATSLAKHYQSAQSIIVGATWNTVVLQETTFEAIPPSLSGSADSKPASFCSAVSTIEQAVHAVAPAAGVYLYETGAPADTAYQNSTSSTFDDAAYRVALGQLTDAYHDAYLAAAAQEGTLPVSPRPETHGRGRGQRASRTRTPTVARPLVSRSPSTTRKGASPPPSTSRPIQDFTIRASMAPT